MKGITVIEHSLVQHNLTGLPGRRTRMQDFRPVRHHSPHLPLFTAAGKKLNDKGYFLSVLDDAGDRCLDFE